MAPLERKKEAGTSCCIRQDGFEDQRGKSPWANIQLSPFEGHPGINPDRISDAFFTLVLESNSMTVRFTLS